LIVCHPSQEYLNDITSLSQYIEEELNIFNVEVTTDEERCGVKWQLTADFGVLGRKLRKDMPKVKSGLSSVSSTQAKEYLETGKINVAGVDLVAGDLTASLLVEALPPAADGSEYDSNTDREVVVLLDINVRPEYEQQAMARQLANQVQKARKEARLNATDDIDVYVKTEESSQATLDELLKSQAEVISRVLKSVPKDARQLPEGSLAFWESPQESPVEVGDHKIWLTLIKLNR
jgi:isoleucyl-tRNA synthetase